MLKYLLLAFIPIIFTALIGHWGARLSNVSSGASDTITMDRDGNSEDFPYDAELGKLTGRKRAITKVVRSGKQDAKILIVIDEQETHTRREERVGMFLLQLRELARYRAAEAIFRIAGGGESGWDAVEQFLPDSDKHSLFHAWLMKGLTNANLFPTVTMWDIINWEKKKRIIEQ